MTTPLNAERLTEIEARANRLCRCDDEACIAELNQVGDQDVPALIAEIKQLRGLLSEFVDDDPCAYDHHGYCQTHGLSASPCRNTRARQLIGVDTPATGTGQQPEPHLVTVTHLPGGFDLSDRRPHEQLIGNGVAGWASHQVTHPDACHHLPYGEQCPFDGEWEHGQYTYDDIEPGLYHVHHAHQDVGDHHGEYSHTETYLDYQRIGDAPERPAPIGSYSSEAPF